MNPSRFVYFAALLMICLLATGAIAQDTAAPAKKDGDPRIQTALDKLKYKYTVNGNKAYELTFDLKEKRSQLVFINSTTQTFSKMEMREITSTAYKVKGKIPADQALRLLADNDKRVWGSWRTVEEGDFTYVVYAVQLPADASAETLDKAIDAVMYTADDMEKEITKADDF